MDQALSLALELQKKKKKKSDAVSLPKKSVIAGEADRWMDN